MQIRALGIGNLDNPFGRCYEARRWNKYMIPKHRALSRTFYSILLGLLVPENHGTDCEFYHVEYQATKTCFGTKGKNTIGVSSSSFSPWPVLQRPRTPQTASRLVWILDYVQQKGRILVMHQHSTSGPVPVAGEGIENPSITNTENVSPQLATETSNDRHRADDDNE